MKIDIIVPVGPKQSSIVKKVIPSLIANLNPYRIYIISSSSTYKSLNLSENERICFLNEDEIVKRLTLKSIKDYFNNRVGSDRWAAWYFQQFLKMGISNLEYITPNYLIWDADCVLLNKLSFINKEGKVLVTKIYEDHSVYFEVTKKLLGVKKEVDFSFVSEHFLFNKEIMREIISVIKGDDNKPWYINLLNSIKDEDIQNSGFSEYETYGNYVVSKYPETFKYRELPVLRYGSRYCGMNPTKFDLWFLSLGYDYVSFETWTEKVYSRKKLISMVYKEWVKRIKAKLKEA